MQGKPTLSQIYDPVVAVLTGDIVQSRRHDGAAVDAAMECIGASAVLLSDMADGDCRFTRFRGDGWQIVLRTAKLALRAPLLVIADLRAADLGIETRISVGSGRWTSLGSHDLSDASGTAFAVSGHHLDDMPRHRRLVIAGGRADESDGVSDRDWQAAVFDLAEWISARWSQPQAEAMSLALRFEAQTHEQLADRLGITRQAMQSRLTGAGHRAFENALAVFEQKDWALPT